MKGQLPMEKLGVLIEQLVYLGHKYCERSSNILVIEHHWNTKLLSMSRETLFMFC